MDNLDEHITIIDGVYTHCSGFEKFVIRHYYQNRFKFTLVQSRCAGLLFCVLTFIILLVSSSLHAQETFDPPLIPREAQKHGKEFLLMVNSMSHLA